MRITVFENYQKIVLFNIANEASYNYILSRQKFILSAKNGKTEAYGQQC